MASNLGDLVATATLDIAPFMTNTKNLKTYMRGLDNSLKAVENSFKGQGGKLKAMKSVYRETGVALKGYQSLLSQQAEKYNALRAEIGNVNTATAAQKEALLGARTAMLETAAKVSELQGRLQKLATETSVFTRFGAAATKVGNTLQNFGNSLTGIGASLTKGLTTPIVAGAGLAVKAAIDFESAFAGVKKTVDEVVDSNGKVVVSYDDLSKGIRNMAKELPASATEIAGVAEAAGQLGIKTQDVLNFSRVMIDMGESTNLSATDAATAIAKIANITGMTADEYSRFGSSIVALGNNFATTESDIVSMANRLAAAGTLAGLTNQEILGLATAMSSVGIEAEAGGTAMTQTLTEIEKAVVAGGEEVQNFARIAGMSAEDFTQAWNEKPIVAVQEFIKGLGELGEQGESATLVLGDLGLNGVRQANMLKSLALASETLSGAVDLSTKAWSENTALTDEANKRYETTESKLKMLKNEVTDVAIEFGGPLVDALREGLEAGKPLIEGLSEMAKKFSSLDKEQQQQIIKWGLMIAAAGPAFTLLGKGVGIIGSVVKGLGMLGTGLGKFSGWIRTLGAVTKGFGAMEAAAGTATAGLGGFAGAASLLGNPVTWGVLLGGAAAFAIGYFADQAIQARKRTEEWGVSVSKAQANELQAFKDKVDETNQAMTTFGADAAKNVDNVKTAFQGLVDEISKLSDKKLAKEIDMAEKAGLSQETINTMKRNANQVVENAKTMSDEVINIYKNASEQHRDLTAQEKEIVLSNQNELINTQLSLLKYSGKERENIVKAMNGQLNELNDAQLQKALDVTKKWIQEENKSYKERKKSLKELHKSIKGEDEAAVKARAEIHAKMQALEAEHNAKMDAYGEKFAAIQKKLIEGALKNSPAESQKTILNAVKKNMEELGLSYEKYMEKSTRALTKAQESNGMWAKSTKDMTEETKLANAQWNALTWDLKKGELKTNAQEEIAKALQAEGGWESMKFTLKHANLETNAKLAIGDALIATGQWDSLTPEEKNLVIDGKDGLRAILESKDNLKIWNEIPAEVKKILGDSSNFTENATSATNLLNAWNLLTPTQKALHAQNLTGPDVELAQQTINSLIGKTASLEANDNTAMGKIMAQASIDSVQQTAPAGINATNNAQPPATAASNAINSVKQNSPAPIEATNKASKPANEAKKSIDSVVSKTVTINAIDNASGVVSGVVGWMSQLVDKTVNIFTKRHEHAKGTNFHPGGLAMVNDQKGSVYRELVTLPSGHSFIPEGRDVLLPLPRGSKVLRASRTKQLFPHYSGGIGFEDTKLANLTQRMGNVSAALNVEFRSQELSDLKYLMLELLAIMRDRSGNGGNGSLSEALDIISRMSRQPIVVSQQVDKREIARLIAQPVSEEQERRKSIENAIYGMRWT